MKADVPNSLDSLDSPDSPDSLDFLLCVAYGDAGRRCEVKVAFRGDEIFADVRECEVHACAVAFEDYHALHGYR